MAQNLNQNKTFPLNKLFSSHGYSTYMAISAYWYQQDQYDCKQFIFI